MARLKNSKLSKWEQEQIYKDYKILVVEGKRPITISNEMIATRFGVSLSTVQHCVKMGKKNDLFNNSVI